MILAGLFARLTFVLLVVGDVLVVATWSTWESSWARAWSMIVWTPVVVSVWLLGIMALLAGRRLNLSLIYGVGVPIVSIIIVTVAISTLSTAGSTGLIGISLLMAAFTVGIIRVLHEILGATRSSPVPMAAQARRLE